MKKQGYSWIIVPVVLLIFKALMNMRGVLDPKSGTLMLFRQWKEASCLTQHIFAFRIHRTNNNVPEVVVTTDFMEQMKELLKNNKMEIQAMTAGPWGDKGDYGMRIRFRFREGVVPFLIGPEHLAECFWTGLGNTIRPCNISYKWPLKCYICESEAHLMAGCLWPEVEVGAPKPNFYNLKNHGPSWEEEQAKPKKAFVEASTDLIDIRPKHERPRIRKEATLKGKEWAMDSKVSME